MGGEGFQATVLFEGKKKKVLEMTYLCEFKITYLLCSLQKMLNNFVTVGSSIIEVVKLLNLSVS